MHNLNDLVIKQFMVGPLGVNCYVLADAATKDACIIDPGAAPEKISDFIKRRGLLPRFIINTHGHGDHIAANGYFNLPIYIHGNDGECLGDPKKNLSRFLTFSVSSPEASKLLKDGDRIPVGGAELEVIHTPGHTSGSISIRIDGIVFTGDALFRGGIGRTDLPGGDERMLLASINKRLFTLPDETIVYPGHGEASTIGEEKRSNPFM